MLVMMGIGYRNLKRDTRIYLHEELNRINEETIKKLNEMSDDVLDELNKIKIK
jgi:hypothetical protein